MKAIVKSHFNKVQRLVCLGHFANIVGAMITIALRTIEVMLNIPPLDVFIGGEVARRSSPMGFGMLGRT